MDSLAGIRGGQLGGDVLGDSGAGHCCRRAVPSLAGRSWVRLHLVGVNRVMAARHSQPPGGRKDCCQGRQRKDAERPDWTDWMDRVTAGGPASLVGRRGADRRAARLHRPFGRRWPARVLSACPAGGALPRHCGPGMAAGGTCHCRVAGSWDRVAVRRDVAGAGSGAGGSGLPGIDRKRQDLPRSDDV
jgi:hypothetical protein